MHMRSEIGEIAKSAGLPKDQRLSVMAIKTGTVEITAAYMTFTDLGGSLRMKAMQMVGAQGEEAALRNNEAHPHR
jgi:hypothetical protein